MNTTYNYSQDYPTQLSPEEFAFDPEDPDISILDQDLWRLISEYEQVHGHPLPNDVKSAMRGWNDNQNQPTRALMNNGGTTSTPREVHVRIGDNAEYIEGLQTQVAQGASNGQYNPDQAAAYGNDNAFGSRLGTQAGPEAIAAMANEPQRPAEGWEDLYRAVHDTYTLPIGSTTGGPELVGSQPDYSALSIAEIEAVVGERQRAMNLLERFSVAIRTSRQEAVGQISRGSLDEELSRSGFARAA